MIPTGVEPWSTFAPPIAANCNGLVVGCVPPSGSFFPVGTNTVFCTAMNTAGQVSNSCSFEVTVQDCQPPVISSVTASPEVLWPPNHRIGPISHPSWVDCLGSRG